MKWPPNSYCHFHRHVADTAILVVEGEQHITEINDDADFTTGVRSYALDPDNAQRLWALSEELVG